jgi:hypothetical protein
MLGCPVAIPRSRTGRNRMEARVICANLDIDSVNESGSMLTR